MATMRVLLRLIEEPDHVLRRVDKEGERFKGLVESMKRDGFKEGSPIECTGPKEGPYVIGRHGMHRYTAAKEAGLEYVWINLLDRALSEDELISGQIIDEATHTEARPAEYGKALRALYELKENKGLTVVDLAAKVRRNPEFVSRALKLSDLDENIANLVDDGEIKVGNALAICALQEACRKLQPTYVVPADVIQHAKQEPVGDFTARVAKIIEEARKGPRAAKVPAPRLRKADDVRAELERSRKDPTSPAGYVAALAWALRQDAVSAAAEGKEAVATGLPEEGAKLRALVAEQAAAIEGLEAALDGERKSKASLLKEVERLNLLVDEKEHVVAALRAGRSPA